MNNKMILIGADIEVFLFNTINGEFHSAEGMLGGTKESPLHLDKQGCAIQEDNVAAEFNVNPTYSHIDMWEDIIYNINYITNHIPEELIVKIEPSAEFPPHQIYTEQGQKFGCEPDFSAYTLLENDPPLPDGLLRSAGGHLHFGIDEPDNIKIDLIKLLDYYLGIPSIILDKDTLRRSLYGKAGCYRLKNYGIEYRTLSNFWIKDKKTVKWVFNNIQRAINILYNPIKKDEILNMQKQTVDIINNQLYSEAQRICYKDSLLALTPIKEYVKK